MLPYQTVRIEQLMVPQLITDAAVVTAIMDCIGGDFVTLIINQSVEESGSATGADISVLASDTTVVTEFVTVAADYAADNVTAHMALYFIDLRGGKRYLRLTYSAGTGAANDMTFSATGILHNLDELPSNAAGRAKSANDNVIIVSG